jgi:murein DD-endopeptidase MepM/ murein hydrolase activator NlpD
MHRALTALIVFIAAASVLPAEGAPFRARHGLTTAQFELQMLIWAREGWRPKTLDGATINNAAIFAGIWEPYNPADPAQKWTADLEMTAAELQTMHDTLSPKGYYPVSISGYEVANQARFGVIWHYDPQRVYYWRAQLTSEEYQELFDQLARCDSTRSAAGAPGSAGAACRWRLVDVDGYLDAGTNMFFALWYLEDGAYAARHGMTRHQLDYEYQATGFEPRKVAPYPLPGGGAAFAEIWHWLPKEIHFTFSHLDSAAYQELFDRKLKQGYTLLDIAAYEGGGNHGRKTGAGASHHQGGQALYNSVWLAPRGPDKMLQLVLPIGGVPNQDWDIGFYQDHDISAIRVDHQGKTWNYDNHNGTDFDIKNFEQMAYPGIPVLAAADGEVFTAEDGHFDKNTCNTGCGVCLNNVVNYIEIDHANGQRTAYYHLKKGSLLVTKGQKVKRGQKIAEVGSSGNSAGPHLHFGVMNGPGYVMSASSGDLVDPFEGPLNPTSENLWMTAPPYAESVVNVFDGGVVNHSLNTCEWLERPDNDLIYMGPFSDSDRVYFWTQFRGGVTASNYVTYKLYRPNATLKWSEVQSPGNFQWHWSERNWKLKDLVNEPGLWRWALEKDGFEIISEQFAVFP